MFIWIGGRGECLVSLPMVNVTWNHLDSLHFIFHFFNHFTASRLVCCFSEAMPKLLSMANPAVLPSNVALVYSVKFGRSAVYSGYNSVPRILIWGTPALIGRVPCIPI
jgi:hypothetical protein